MPEYKLKLSGVVIVRDGKPLTNEQIVTALNRAEVIATAGSDKLDAFNEINTMCWEAKGNGETTIPVNKILEVIEAYCD